MGERKTSALLAKCRFEACGYAWIIAFLPMNMSDAGALGKRAACPMCGDAKPQLGCSDDLSPTMRAHLEAMTIGEGSADG